MHMYIQMQLYVFTFLYCIYFSKYNITILLYIHDKFYLEIKNMSDIKQIEIDKLFFSQLFFS